MRCDVAIIGGGPGGTTVASLLKQFNPTLDVVIIERERFPRDHVGESQLPPISQVLDTMGVWDKVESEGFPIKLGASYTWGKTKEPWVFGFIPDAEVGDTTRPGKYEGWRRRVAFQVDRARYDLVLLEHAKSLGVRVLQPRRVLQVAIGTEESGTEESGTPSGGTPSGGTPSGGNLSEWRGRAAVEGLVLDDGERLEAQYYVDASGNAAVLRRALGIEVEVPTRLKNIAFWDYWERDGLNDSLLKHGTMRVLIRSVPYGWIWYIALSEHRTSVGLVCNAEYFKKLGESHEQLYHRALKEESSIAAALRGANSRGEVSSTTDWSYVAMESCGRNWFLVGESLGFADPILAAGLTLTHTCAEHCAYTILDLVRGNKDSVWLRDQYHETQTRRVRQHIKFAEYWYSANGLFSEILDHCALIAEQSGLSMDPQEAFRWLSHGGVEDIPGQFGIGGLGLAGVKSVQKRFAHANAEDVVYLIDGMNTFDLAMEGVKQQFMALPRQGTVEAIPVLIRGASRLPLTGFYLRVTEVLQQHRYADSIIRALLAWISGAWPDAMNRHAALQQAFSCLESMVAQGWVHASKTAGMATLSMKTPDEGEIVFTERLGPISRRP
jgi:flavin-dependent dehydrogenase